MTRNIEITAAGRAALRRSTAHVPGALEPRRLIADRWQEHLDLIAARLSELYTEVYEATRLMRPEDQLELLDAAGAATSTNCPWTTYRAAAFVVAALPSRRALLELIAKRSGVQQ